MAGNRCLCHSEVRAGFGNDPGHASDQFRNSDILIHFLGNCVYGSSGAFAVVSANQWLSIDGRKHIGWNFFTNVA